MAIASPTPSELPFRFACEVLYARTNGAPLQLSLADWLIGVDDPVVSAVLNEITREPFNVYKQSPTKYWVYDWEIRVQRDDRPLFVSMLQLTLQPAPNHKDNKAPHV